MYVYVFFEKQYWVRSLMMAIKKRTLHFSFQLYTILLVLVLNACAITVPSPILEQQRVPHMQEFADRYSEKGWSAVRFTISWDKSSDPEWYIGTLIAGEVISPLLRKEQQKIIFWRIHRRAVDDKTGHVFSFIFYSSQVDAALIYQRFRDTKLIAQLRHQQLLLKVTYDALDNRQTNLADSSDPAWPETIRSSWPFFMMGASQMWLEQIRIFKKETLNEPDMQQRYQLIQSKMTELWQRQGGHALMHHLNALYAYQPVLVQF